MSRIQRIKDRLSPGHVEALCKAWLPGGKMKGRWYMVCSPFRQERSPSFGVKCSPNYGWYDFGSGGGDGGDMIDLTCRLHGATVREAIEAFEAMLGIDDAS